MNTHTNQIATQLRAVYFGGNWTWVNFKEVLDGVTWEMATRKIDSLNTILALLYHSCYYVRAQIGVLETGELHAKDKYAFDHPPISSEDEWKAFVNDCWTLVERLAALIEKMPDERLWETFINEKYGNFYRNLHGQIEHAHYHLGQIVLLKKMMSNGEQ
jgi:hypothetical protein